MLLLNSFMTLALGKDPSGKCTLCHLVLWVDAVRWILADWCDPWGPWCHQPIINIIKFCCCNWELLCVKFWSIIPYILCNNLSGVNYSSASNHILCMVKYHCTYGSTPVCLLWIATFSAASHVWLNPIQSSQTVILALKKQTESHLLKLFI